MHTGTKQLSLFPHPAPKWQLLNELCSCQLMVYWNKEYTMSFPFYRQKNRDLGSKHHIGYQEANLQSEASLPDSRAYGLATEKPSYSSWSVGWWGEQVTLPAPHTLGEVPRGFSTECQKEVKQGFRVTVPEKINLRDKESLKVIEVKEVIKFILHIGVSYWKINSQF